MKANLRDLAVSMIYAAILSWIYLYEIVPNWEYMGFSGEFSLKAVIIVAFATFVLGASVPKSRDARMMIVAPIHYIYFIPATVYLAFSDASAERYAAFAILILCFYYVSTLKINAPSLIPIQEKSLFGVVAALVLFSIAGQAYFGGLRHFNLNIERVYEFRTAAAAELPAIFGYIYSNVSTVLLPIAAVWAFRSGRYLLSGLMLAFAVALFGMTHHKAVLFGPFVVAGLYVFFSRAKPSLIGLAFLSIPCLASIELLYTRLIIGTNDVAYFTSLSIRRVFFMPPMLDSMYVEFFSKNAQYFWSASRFGSWAGENPYGTTAPFVIGTAFFKDAETSANAGAIGSGFANAGLIGVALYSLLIGILIAMLNAYGERAGHALVAAGSFVTMFFVITTTDLSTAFLSHGLFLLVIIFSLFPVATRNRPFEAVAT